MSDDAWRAPEAPAARVPVAGGKTYQPLRNLTLAVIGVLAGALVFRWVGLIAQAALVMLDPSLIDDPEAMPAGVGDGALLAVSGVATLTSVGLTMLLGVPAWVAWHWRAGGNLVACARDFLQYSPGSHAGYWFVPFANLVVPYRAMGELFRASAPSTDPGGWSEQPLPSSFPVWWGMWLVGNVAANLSFRMSLEGVGSEVTTVLDLVSEPLATGATLLYLKYVWEIDHRQVALAEGRTS